MDAAGVATSSILPVDSRPSADENVSSLVRACKSVSRRLWGERGVVVVYLPVCPANDLATLWRYEKHSVEAVHGWLRRGRVADRQDRSDGVVRIRIATGACWIATPGRNAR